MTNVFGFNNAPRWAQIRTDYEQYAVKGLKLEYIPTNSRGISYGGTSANIHSLWFSSDLNNYNQLDITDEQLMRSGQLKMLDPTRKFSKYLSFKGLSRSQKLDW